MREDKKPQQGRKTDAGQDADHSQRSEEGGNKSGHFQERAVVSVSWREYSVTAGSGFPATPS